MNNIIPQIQIVPSKNPICTTWQCDFRCISLNSTRTVPCVAMKYKIYFMARVGSTNFQITKMAGYEKEIDVVDESHEKNRVLQEGRPENKEVEKFAIH